jgi:hypothetical protein
MKNEPEDKDCDGWVYKCPNKPETGPQVFGFEILFCQFKDDFPAPDEVVYKIDKLTEIFNEFHESESR